MLAHTRTVKDAKLKGLYTLDAEGMMLHSAMHVSGHFFEHGLKTAWDFLWLLDRFPELDWKRLKKWVDQCGMGRGFWVPVRVLSEELSIPFPASFLALAPNDKRQQKLESFARRHLFGTTKFRYTDNQWVCQGLYGLMSDSWLHRARFGFKLLFGRYSRQRRQTRRKKILKSVSQWRSLREAVHRYSQLG
jgi:hypothetical protein